MKCSDFEIEPCHRCKNENFYGKNSFYKCWCQHYYTVIKSKEDINNINIRLVKSNIIYLRKAVEIHGPELLSHLEKILLLK